MLTENKRDRLRLSLNRSLSEPGEMMLASPVPPTVLMTTEPSPSPTKKCRFDAITISLPASPCSDSATIQRALVLKRVQRVCVNSMAKKVRRICSASSPTHQFLVVDCRPFLTYNVNHIRNAINVNCSDRFNRKRLQLGKATLADLATTKQAKELLRRKLYQEVIVYDDNTTDLERLPLNHTLFIVLSALTEDNKDISFLSGGYKEFQKEYPDLCEVAPRLTVNCDEANTGLPSPMDFEWDIENHPASRVLPFLYVGNERDASDLERLQGLGINHVLNVTSHLPGFHENHGIRYKQLPAADSSQQNLKQYFEEAFEFIDNARQSGYSILVHCQAGVSRSPTIVIAYLMKHKLLTMVDAYKLVKSSRSIISPNLNFMGQLVEFEQGLRDSNKKEPECKPCRECCWTYQPKGQMTSGCSV